MLQTPTSYTFKKAVGILLGHVPWTAIILRSDISFSPSLSPLKNIEKKNDTYIVTSNLLTISGVYGPLPHTDAERFLHSYHQEEFKHFFDLFHHRIYHNLYFLENKQNIVNIRKNIEGFLKSRSFHFVSFFLRKTLQVPCTLKPFQGQWIYAKNEEQSRIGIVDGQFCVLGYDAILGVRVWNQMHSLRIDIGPLSYKKFQYFLSAEGQKILKFITEVFKISAFFYLYVKANEVIPTILGEKFGLGKSTWINPRQLDRSFCAYVHVS